MTNQLSKDVQTNLLSPQVWNTLKDQATVLLQSGFLPTSIKTGPQAIAIMMKGYELGIPPMQALSEIDIIQGRPTCKATLQLALIYKNCPGAKIDFLKIEDDECLIRASRPSGKPTEFRFDKEDATRAGLINKDNWKKHPRAMFRSRCVSEMARSMFPDALMGMSYTPEELNPDIEICEEGNIVSIPPPKPRVFDPASEDAPKVLKTIQDKFKDREFNAEYKYRLICHLEGKEMIPGWLENAVQYLDSIYEIEKSSREEIQPEE
jgi:hypothetical protein